MRTGTYYNKQANNIFIELSVNLTIYKSYNTIIAVKYNGQLYARENTFSQTTGKHLNCLEPDKNNRLSSSDFSNLLSKISKETGIDL